ncbi:MAG: SRPBCC family protein [Caldilineaceae bacterium]
MQQQYQSSTYAEQGYAAQPRATYPPQARRGQSFPNVATTERQVAVLVGGALVLHALVNHSRSALFTGPLGMALILHGQSNRSPIYDALHVNTSEYAPRYRSDGHDGATQQREAPQRVGRTPQPGSRPMPPNTIEIERAVTVNKPAEELYNYWRQLENLPNFMEHLQEVKQTGDKQSHWVAKVSGGVPVTWDAEIVEDVPGQRIVWRTLPDSRVEQRGTVEFKPATGERGTVVAVDIQYSPPGGIVGETFAQLVNGVTAQQVKDDIRRFKSLMETGETPTIEGQPSGRS